jgi:hypothetical protein
MMKQHGFTRPRVSFSLCLDISMFVLVCVLMSVSLTGLPLHEWLGIALCPLVLLHVNWHAQWYLDQFRRMLTRCAYRARINFLLNIALLVLMAGLVVSGLFRSHQLSAIVGEGIGRPRVWKNVHDWSSVAVMSLASLHLGLNWDWIMAAIRRHSRETSLSAKDPVSNVAPSARPNSVFANLLGKTVAITGITVFAAFAVYVATAVMTPTPIIRAPAAGQQTLTRRTAENPGDQRPESRRPPTRRGFMLFTSTFLGAFAVAMVARYAFRLHL